MSFYIKHTEPDRDGDVIAGLKTALICEAVVVVFVLMVLALIVDAHAIIRFVEW